MYWISFIWVSIRSPLKTLDITTYIIYKAESTGVGSALMFLCVGIDALNYLDIHFKIIESFRHKNGKLNPKV